ncbi:MAG: trypsin-like peptidase domain-containing protein [Candidatus Hydrogenedentes bacterium]|nr:trypsin-like peptidase domain-containing protein [Candidatus Hydrogenedentota bacterium]
MKHPILILGLSAIVMTGCATAGLSGQGAVIRAKERVAPALVYIRPVKEVFTEGKREEVVVVGSGFIISADGYVVTNEHVAGESKLVRCVLYDKNELEADVVGVDPFTDIAVVKLKTDRKDLPHVKLGSSKTLEAGQVVLALGSPHGLARSVSQGIVSVTDRYLDDNDEMVSPFNNWIQTDAAINPGNSGGPLVNINGEVIGINTRKLGGADNVGFAIPIDIAKEVISQIIDHGRVIRSWLGISLQETTSKTNDPKQMGVIIGDVDPLGPAAEAKILPGDIMLSIDGKSTNARFVEDLPKVRKLMADLPVGKAVSIAVSRGGAPMDITLTTVEKSAYKGEEVEFKEWGFTASALTPVVVRTAQLSSNRGVLVSGAQATGIAAEARLQPGDIILKVDGKEIQDLADFRKTYQELVAAKKRLTLVDVKRGALNMYLIVKQGAEEKAKPDTATAGTPGDGHHE